MHPGAYPPPPLPITPDDHAHLNVLRICYLISAALTAVGALFCFGIGLFGLVGVAAGPEGAIFGGIWAAFGFFIGLFLVLVAYLEYLVAQSLVEMRRKTLCYVIAAITATNIPLGTILGIFTFIVMARPQVSAAFDANDSPLIRP